MTSFFISDVHEYLLFIAYAAFGWKCPIPLTPFLSPGFAIAWVIPSAKRSLFSDIVHLVIELLPLAGIRRISLSLLIKICRPSTSQWQIEPTES